LKGQRKIREEFLMTFDVFATKAKCAPISPFEYVGKQIIDSIQNSGSSQFYRLLCRLIEEAKDASVINVYSVLS